MRLTARLFRDISKSLDHYSQFNPSPLSIKQFIDFVSGYGWTQDSMENVKFEGRNACEKTSYLFLCKEVPVRLANIMKEIHLLPEGLLKMPSASTVQSLYYQSFQDILEFENADPDDREVLNNFALALVKIRNRHQDVVQMMAHGVVEMKQSYPIDSVVENNLQYFLDRFFMSRISIRMLMNQHTLLFGAENTTSSRHIGSIDPKCDIKSVVEDAYETARFLCERYYMVAPKVKITEIMPDDSSGKTVVYVPSHLYHMLFELFKNSMRAVVEHVGIDEIEFPPVEVHIVKGKDDLTIKVSDMGGGIPRSLTQKLFQYMYTTAPEPSPSGDISAPLAGYGYGLPLSRLYARYFHGDLILNSYQGYGTDAVIYLRALSCDAHEMLPLFNKTTSSNYQSAALISDWATTGAGGPNLMNDGKRRTTAA